VPIQAYRNNLDTLAQLAKAAGAVPVFLVLPCDRDLGPTDLEAPRPAYRVAMRDAAERQSGVLVEAPAHFVGKSPDHFFDDVHPTAKGHAIVGRLLAQGIASRIKRSSR
jgi:lysophospholipase L1-like esterase